MERIEKRLALLYNLRKNQIDTVLKEHHLIYEEYQVLKLLHYVDGLSLDDIYEVERLRFISTELNVHYFIDKGFVEMKDEKLYLTEYAKKLYLQVKKSVNQTDENVMEKIGKDEFNEIINALDKLIEYYE